MCEQDYLNYQLSFEYHKKKAIIRPDHMFFLNMTDSRYQADLT